MITLLVAMFHVLAAEALDHDMNSQEQKNTGVYKLSDKEKSALQQWVDSRYEKRSQPMNQGTQQTSTLQENLRNGRYIRLANGTLWNIHPSDANVAQGWITPVDIVVTQSGDSSYPYKLTNSVTGSSIRARKSEDLPKAAPQPAPTPAPAKK